GRVDLPTRVPGEVTRLNLVGQESIRIPLEMDDRETKPYHMSIRRIEEEIAEVLTARRTFEERRDLEAAMALTLGTFDELASPQFATSTAIIGGQRRRDGLRTEFHSRFAMACSCLFFVLVGTPFAILGA